MLDFDVRRTTRRCNATDRQLVPGEVFYSVLRREGSQFSREDFSADAWTGPPDDCVGWWKCRIPETDQGRVFWAPNEVLVTYFEQLLSLPAMAPTLFVMTLVLIRRRLLEVTDTVREENEQETMIVRVRKTGQTHEIRVIPLDDQQIHEIQQDLGEQLFTDQPPAEI